MGPQITLTEDRFGMTESAYSFDGKDDYLFTDLDDRKGDFTLSLWAKANDIEQSRYRSVINIHDKTPGSAATCQIHTSGGRYPTYQLFSSNPESFAFTLVTAEWQHLAVTVSGKVVRFYENGKRVYSQELEGGAANKFSNIIIGRNRHGGAIYNGSIDDVYVYNRAINDAEVGRLFDGGLEDSDGDGLTDDYETGKLRYQAISGSFTWEQAKEDAENRGGHLATITSEAEWTSLKERFLEKFLMLITLVVPTKRLKESGNGSLMKSGILQNGHQINPTITSERSMETKTTFILGKKHLMEIVFGMIIMGLKIHGPKVIFLNSVITVILTIFYVHCTQGFFCPFPGKSSYPDQPRWF